MARPRTPTNIIDLKGAFKVNPERKRPAEPAPNAPFDLKPPAYLLACQKKTWREVVKRVPAGVLGDADRMHVEIVACLLADFRSLQGAMDTTRIGRLTQEMGKLGLNPSARASLVVDKPKANKYADD